MKLGKYLSVIVTPFNEDMSVNYDEAIKLGNHMANNGVEGLVIAATGGESATLTLEERIKLTRVMKKEFEGKIPIIVGTGTNNTMESINVTKHIEKAGADAILLVTPYYNKPTQDGLYLHFESIAKSTELPVLLYNVPGRTGVNIQPETIVRLAQVSNIVGMKEASGNLDYVTKLLLCVPEHFHVYTGDDNLALAALSTGVYGLISVVAQVAGNEIKEMLDAYWNKDMIKASRLHQHLFPLIDVLFISSNPIPTKVALNLMGFNVGGLRLPLTMPSKNHADQIAKVLKELNYIDNVEIPSKLYI